MYFFISQKAYIVFDSAHVLLRALTFKKEDVGSSAKSVVLKVSI